MSDRARLLVAALVSPTHQVSLDTLRRALDSDEIERIPPHLTLIAPFNLAVSEIDRLAVTFADVIAATPPIDLHLSAAATFPPPSRVIYLECAEGSEAIATLRDRCHAALAVPVEERPFVAHLTLRSHAEERLVLLATELLRRHSLHTTVDRVGLFIREESEPSSPWRPLDIVALGSAMHLGAGGLATDLLVACQLSTDDRALLTLVAEEAAASGGYRLDRVMQTSPEECIVVRAYRDGELCGVLYLTREGRFGEIHALAVPPSARDQGVGRAMMHYLERYARQVGIEELLFTGDASLAVYLRSLGFLSRAGESSGAVARLSRLL